MNILEFAKKMEKDGEAYYRNLAEITRETGVKTILNNLANAELNHYETLVKLQQDGIAVLLGSHILDRAKNIFQEIKIKELDPSFYLPQIDVYQKALEIEKQSMEFYRQKAELTETQAQKKIFLAIAEEEKQHYFLIDNILGYMQQPYRWLENAEWNHLDEY